MSARPRPAARSGIGRQLLGSRAARVVLALAAVGGGFGAASVPAHAAAIAWGTVLIPGSQWAGGDAGLGDLNVYSNGSGAQDQLGTFGLQYECTELVQRYAHYKFGEPANWPVSSAADMWNAGPSLPNPLAQEPNGGPTAPQHGDIIVYAATSSDPTGHVGVVSSVTSSSVTVVQQNFTVNGTPTGAWTESMSGTSVSPLGSLPVLGWLHAGSVVATPPPPPAPLTSLSALSAAITPDGAAQTLFWKGADGHLAESWYASSAWHGPVEYPQFAGLQSPPAVAITPNGRAQMVFWQGTDNHLHEAWFTTGWNGPVDLTASWGGAAPPTSAPSVTVTPDGTQLLFWRGPDGHLWEAWFAGGRWNGPANFSNSNTLASAPSASVLPNSTAQMVFWHATDGYLYESWFAGGHWNGPVPLFSSVQSAPSVSVTPDGSAQLLFWRGPANHLYEAWYTNRWNGPVDVTSAAGSGLPLSSSPTSAVTPNGRAQVVFFQGPGNAVYEAWWAASHWNGPVPLSA